MIAASLVLSVVASCGGAAPSPPGQLLAAGDIARCDSEADTETAALLDTLEGEIAVVGDATYDRGTYDEYERCWEPRWGRHDARVHAAPGDHDYESGRQGYDRWFGEPESRGWYSYPVGSWRALSLDSEGDLEAQVTWVGRVASDHECVVAYFHRPLVSSGVHGSNPAVAPLWEALYDVGADVVLGGDDHDYERFAPLGRDGPPAEDGMRAFVVGTGGTDLRPFDEVKAGSEARNADDHGVLALTLGGGSYDWRFHPVADDTFTDEGSGSCRS